MIPLKPTIRDQNHCYLFVLFYILDNCPPGWHAPSSGYCYQVYRANRTLDYDEAVAECEALDATLVSPTSQVFNEDIAAMMANASTTAEPVWVGIKHGANPLNPRDGWRFENGAYFRDEQWELWDTTYVIKTLKKMQGLFFRRKFFSSGTTIH